MPQIKMQENNSGGAEESDGDVSGADSDHTNTSGDHGSSEDEADSDESSEMDEGECEQRRNECMDNLSELERQFTVLREQLYRERIAQVDHQLAEVKEGRSQEYLGPLQELQENKRIRIKVAGKIGTFPLNFDELKPLLVIDILRRLRLNNVRNKFEAEEQAALQNFESEKSLAWDYFYDDLMNTIRRLEEDRHNSELNWGDGLEWGSRSRSRSRRKAVTVSGPYIVYMLRPQDIMEDWTLIRKALKRSP